MPDNGLDHVPSDALELIELLINFKADFSSKFVYAWMELPHVVRKEYSYNGAIRCRRPSDPCHYQCPIEKERYFDPTNFVYAITMLLMMPNMMQEVNWNNETKGDIFESIMGCAYLVHNGLMTHDVDALKKHSGIVSAIFESFAWHTYQLCVTVDHKKILVWVKWILDMVSYRQMNDIDVSLIVDIVDNDNGPRCKRNGNLMCALVS